MPRKPTGKPNGKPPFKPTKDHRKTVELMCAVGIPHEGIAACIGKGSDDKTLRKYFAPELKTAKIKANTNVAGTLYTMAIGGNIPACIWWTKTQMGWKDTSVIETIRINPINEMTEDELDARIVELQQKLIDEGVTRH